MVSGVSVRLIYKFACTPPVIVGDEIGFDKFILPDIVPGFEAGCILLHV